MNENYIFKYIDQLNSWILSQNYLGWDVYDGLNSDIIQRITNNNHYLKLFIIQLNKYSPINLRPILQIKKGIDLKGIAILTQAYSHLYNITNDEQITKQLKYCVDFIKNSSLEKYYKAPCWASHYFPYTSLGENKLDKTTPDIIGTCESINALIDYYLIYKEPDLEEYIKNAIDFLLNNFILNEEKIYVKYTLDSKETITYNIYGKTLQTLSKSYKIFRITQTSLYCEKIVNFLENHQNTNGSWEYSITKNRIRKQYDFHQGYIIDGLLEYITLKKYPTSILNIINKASDFYLSLFNKEGYSYYRYPLKYPVDIHNQAQGIITFSKLTKINKNYFTQAKKVLNWTLSNMKDPMGFYYYQKWPLITNKIPHMRWAQAWMCLALVNILEVTSC